MKQAYQPRQVCHASADVLFCPKAFAQPQLVGGLGASVCMSPTAPWEVRVRLPARLHLDDGLHQLGGARYTPPCNTPPSRPTTEPVFWGFAPCALDVPQLSWVRHPAAQKDSVTVMVFQTDSTRDTRVSRQSPATYPQPNPGRTPDLGDEFMRRPSSDRNGVPRNPQSVH